MKEIKGYCYFKQGEDKDWHAIYIYKKKPAGTYWDKVIVKLAKKTKLSKVL